MLGLWDLENEEEHELHGLGTERLSEVAEIVRRLAPPGSWLLLNGDLGAGKTTLTQHLAQKWGVEGVITSPTFAVLNALSLRAPYSRLLHLDLYRVRKPNEICFLGIEAEIDPRCLVVVEWAEAVDEEGWEEFFELTRCPRPTGVVNIDITHTPEGLRDYHITRFVPRD